MSLRAIAIALMWVGVVALLGLMVHRFTRGAWSLEDDDIPVISTGQKLLAALALGLTAAGVALFVWSWNGMG
ncbi:protein of unknown function [Magnetospirillum sp. XM-1]|uniref:hypothetical protein n=1 Tax=Magnetospirillum sp. XM-1 TaxID=1663591 RepID=UPI00073DB7B7|nr:hypothetical protein [Magnetospirillum sp. XM-1]CUW40143.1 protein of unknown function [Magnetospirillum sp. XM-1]